MKTYKMTFRAMVEGTAHIDAKNKEEAKNLLRRDLFHTKASIQLDTANFKGVYYEENKK